MLAVQACFPCESYTTLQLAVWKGDRPSPSLAPVLPADPGCVALGPRPKVSQHLVSASLPLCLCGVLSVLLFRVNKLFL